LTNTQYNQINNLKMLDEVGRVRFGATNLSYSHKMKIIVCTDDGSTKFDIGVDMHKKVQASQCANETIDTEKQIRRDISVLCCPSIPIVYFTPSMQICCEALTQDTTILNKSRMQDMLQAMGTAIEYTSQMDPHLIKAITLSFNLIPDIACLQQETQTIVDFVQANLYHKCNVRVMCVMHQLLGRVLDIESGKIVLDATSYIDTVCNQLWSTIVFFFQHHATFPVHVLNFVIKDIGNQLRIYYQVKVVIDKNPVNNKST
jgi:hypothetical protein